MEIKARVQQSSIELLKAVEAVIAKEKVHVTSRLRHKAYTAAQKHDHRRFNGNNVGFCTFLLRGILAWNTFEI